MARSAIAEEEARASRRDIRVLIDARDDLTARLEESTRTDAVLRADLRAAMDGRVDLTDAGLREIWVIEEGVEGEGVYTLAICHSKVDALKVQAYIEKERGHPCPELEPEVYHLPDEYAAAIRAQEGKEK